MELLQRRKLCREFLNAYNEKLHPQIISKVFEIGLLTLKNRFNKLLFSKEELDNIIKNLSMKENLEIVPLPSLKKLQKFPPPSYQYPTQDILNTENYENNDIKILKKQKLLDNTLKNPNFQTQNSSIYPHWWWNNKEEDEVKNRNNGIYNEENYIHYKTEDFNNYANSEQYETINNNRNLININEEDYDESKFQNYGEKERENDEIKNKNFAIKKLTMNNKQQKRIVYDYSGKGPNFKRVNNISFNRDKNNKILNQKKIPTQKKNEQIQRDKSTKTPSRKMNSFTKINKIQAPKSKILNKPKNLSQRKNNAKLSNIPKYKYTYINGRILRIPEDNNNYVNLTMTEPHKY